MNQVFDAVLEVRFRQCPGHRKITQKEYALQSKTQTEDIERTVDFRRCFYPGRRVEMFMVFVRIYTWISVCPNQAPTPAPESQEYQKPNTEWYNSLALSLV